MFDVVPEPPDIINLSETPINLILFSWTDIMRKFKMTVSGENVFQMIDSIFNDIKNEMCKHFWL